MAKADPQQSKGGSSGKTDIRRHINHDCILKHQGGK